MSLWITILSLLSYPVMTNREDDGHVFYPIPTQIMDLELSLPGMLSYFENSVDSD